MRYTLTTCFTILASCSALMALQAAVFQAGTALPSTTVSSALVGLYLADKLDVSGYYSAHSVDGNALGELLNAAPPQSKPQMVVFVHGVRDPARFFNTTGSVVEAAGYEEMVYQATRDFPTLMGELKAVVQLSPEIQMIGDPQSGLVDRFASLAEEMEALWPALRTRLESLIPSTETNGYSARAAAKYITDKTFIDELTQLHRLQALVSQPSTKFVVDLHSLLSVANKVGVDSVTYEACQRMLAAVLARFDQFQVSVVALPVEARGGLPASQKTLRLSQRDAQRVYVHTKRDGQVATVGYTSEASCNVATANCNNHGKCINTGSVWTCMCAPTFDKAKSKTTKWAGAACEKKDVSAEFNLLLWTGIGLAALMAAGIKTLAAVGAEELPGVLEAATIKKSA